jgi:hypothetical protein
MKSWIFLPKKVIVEVSNASKSRVCSISITHDIELSTPESLIKEFTSDLDMTNARYIRIQAENVGFCPDWHPGAGGKAWLFVDEIIVQ